MTSPFSSSVAIAVAVGAFASAAQAQQQAQQVTREEIEAAADGIGIPDGVDRQCVIDRAVEEAPNVGVNLVGVRGLSTANQQRANELGRRVRVGGAVQAGIRDCTLETSPPPAQTDTVTDAQP